MTRLTCSAIFSIALLRPTVNEPFRWKSARIWLGLANIVLDNKHVLAAARLRPKHCKFKYNCSEIRKFKLSQLMFRIIATSLLSGGGHHLLLCELRLDNLVALLDLLLERHLDHILHVLELVLETLELDVALLDCLLKNESDRTVLPSSKSTP